MLYIFLTSQVKNLFRHHVPKVISSSRRNLVFWRRNSYSNSCINVLPCTIEHSVKKLIRTQPKSLIRNLRLTKLLLLSITHSKTNHACNFSKKPFQTKRFKTYSSIISATMNTTQTNLFHNSLEKITPQRASSIV